MENRPENLLGFEILTDEAREMKRLLIEEYKKQGRSLIDEIKNWREAHPQATLQDAIEALYRGVENSEA